MLTLTDVKTLRNQPTDNYGGQYERAVSMNVVNCN